MWHQQPSPDAYMHVMNFQSFARRSISNMSIPTANVSPFTKAVVVAMKKLYPEKLADSSFDNTGLLLEAPYRRRYLNNSVLLTVDLTKAVADEAIARKDSIIVTYHPIIFRPLKSITQANSQQASLLRLAQEGISVYSPHTAVDAAPGGLNDWLVDVLTSDDVDSGLASAVPHHRSVITPVKEPPPRFEEAGYGRVVRFTQRQKLSTLINRAIRNLQPEHQLEGLSVATPQSVPTGERGNIKISSVGICAGSGGSMLNGLDVDLLFTGELSHHEALAATEQGKCVITVFHSNSERGFLAKRMRRALGVQIQEEIEVLAREGKWEYELSTEFQVGVSKIDRDPFEVVTRENMAGW